MESNKKKNITYTLIDNITILTDTNEKDGNWKKEVNIMTWGKNKTPVIDIRKWNREEEMMGKGISLTLEQFKQLQNIDISQIESYFNK